MALPSATDLSGDEGASSASVFESAPPVATARELAHALVAYEVDDLQPAQPDLAAAVAELALTAGKAWLVSDEDPVVVLLRVLARVSAESPDATSTHAAEIVAQYGRVGK